MTAIDRTAYPRLPSVLPARELMEVFTPTDAEVLWARERTESDAHLLSLLMLLKCFQRLSYFPRLEQVPSEVAGHLRGLLGLPAVLAAGHQSDRTAKRHRRLVRERLGVLWDPTRIHAVATAAIREALQSKDNPADVINVALEELARAGCELPGYGMLDEMVASLRFEVNGELQDQAVALMGEADRHRLLGLLEVDPGSRRSGLDRLKQPARKATVTRLREHIGYLRWLTELGEVDTWLAGISPAKIEHFAGEAAVLDVAELRDVNVAKRLTVIGCLLRVARVRARDELVTMFCKRMAAITQKARDHLDWLREQHRAESERLLGVFGEVLAGVREALGPGAEEPGDAGSADPMPVVWERAGRTVLKTLIGAGGVAALSGAQEAVAAHHGNNYFPLMERYYRSHRSAFFDLLDVVELEATSTDRAVLDAVVFLRANRHRVGEYIPGTVDGQLLDLSFAAVGWQGLLRRPDRPARLARRHLEVCVFAYLAGELRAGDIAVRGAGSYANLHAQLMSWAECEPLVQRYCAQAGIPGTAAEAVTRWRTELEQVAAQVDAGYPDNTDLVLDGGRPMLKRRLGRDRRATALALEDAVKNRLPERGLLDILARAAYRTGWTRHFGPASGSDPKLRDAFGRYVLTLFAYGSLLGPAQAARHLGGQVSAHELSLAFNKHMHTDRLQAADTDVINHYADLDVAKLWGEGSVVAADGSQIDTWENSLLAETSVRYGGFGAIAYRHVSDTYIALFSRFIPCGVWEAVYILDGLLQNDSDIQPETIHADTQGQSLPVYGLAVLLGFDLLPRIRNWHDLIFYRPDAQTRYRHIDTLFDHHCIDWNLIQTHWPDLMRTVISIREGHLSSVTLLRRLGHDSRKNRLYRAFRELGRVLRTIVLLRYLSDPGLRETITAITNRVEAYHGFAGWLSFGAENGVIARNDPAHQEKLVKFNQLLANCVIYDTACEITTVANALAAEGHPVDPVDLATISPYLTEPIRRFGDWHLDLTPPATHVATHLEITPPPASENPPSRK